MTQYTCPVDDAPLVESKLGDDDSRKCPECSGSWVPMSTLEAFEDKHFRDDMVKGQRRYGERSVEHDCPHCGESMTRFRYRGYNLELEACPENVGFWLDRGEDKRIKEVMKTRVSRMQRSGSAQVAWEHFRRGDNRSFFQKIKDLFTG